MLNKTNLSICVWDIETSFMLLPGFGLFDNNVRYDQIIQDWYIICGSWKYLGRNEVYSTTILEQKDYQNNRTNDYFVVKKLREILEGVDVLIHHNGDKFDLKKLNARIIYWGLPPLPKIVTIDTLKVARKEAKFTSNRLDYLAQHFKCGGKKKTKPNLWVDALLGKESAIVEMDTYCKQDVRILEKVYLKLRPYMTNHPNLNLFKDKPCCSNCGKQNIQWRGFVSTKTSRKKRYKCNSCNHWGYSTVSDKLVKIN